MTRMNCSYLKEGWRNHSLIWRYEISRFYKSKQQLKMESPTRRSMSKSQKIQLFQLLLPSSTWRKVSKCSRYHNSCNTHQANQGMEERLALLMRMGLSVSARATTTISRSTTHLCLLSLLESRERVRSMLRSIKLSRSQWQLRGPKGMMNE